MLYLSATCILFSVCEVSASIIIIDNTYLRKDTAAIVDYTSEASEDVRFTPRARVIIQTCPLPMWNTEWTEMWSLIWSDLNSCLSPGILLFEFMPWPQRLPPRAVRTSIRPIYVLHKLFHFGEWSGISMRFYLRFLYEHVLGAVAIPRTSGIYYGLVYGISSSYYTF